MISDLYGLAGSAWDQDLGPPILNLMGVWLSHLTTTTFITVNWLPNKTRYIEFKLLD